MESSNTKLRWAITFFILTSQQYLLSIFVYWGIRFCFVLRDCHGDVVKVVATLCGFVGCVFFLRNFFSIEFKVERKRQIPIRPIISRVSTFFFSQRIFSPYFCPSPEIRHEFFFLEIIEEGLQVVFLVTCPIT